jgi:hypothetical protein
MANRLFQYQLFCNTENANVTTWRYTEPEFCPNSHEHTFDKSTLRILSSTSETGRIPYVRIFEEDTVTGGHFRSQSFKLSNIQPHSTQTFVKSFPYNITVYQVKFFAENAHKGDVINSFVFPDTIFGAINRSVNIGDNTFRVPLSQLANLQVGWVIKITDGANTDLLGDIVSIDTTTGIVTTTGVATHNYSPLSPTYVKLSIQNVKDYEIRTEGDSQIGRSKLGGSTLPKGVAFRVDYTNNSDVVKDWVFNFEYTY